MRVRSDNSKDLELSHLSVGSLRRASHGCMHTSIFVALVWQVLDGSQRSEVTLQLYCRTVTSSWNSCAFLLGTSSSWALAAMNLCDKEEAVRLSQTVDLCKFTSFTHKLAWFAANTLVFCECSAASSTCPCRSMTFCDRAERRPASCA